MVDSVLYIFLTSPIKLIYKHKGITMGKDTKKEEVAETVEANDIKIEGSLYWDGLVTIKDELAREILTQQHLVLELAKKYEDTLSKDTELTHAANGLMGSVKDLAEDVAKILEQHKTADGSFRMGEIKDDNADDALEYLRIASQYIAVGENLNNLVSTAYLDIFTKLSVDTKELSKVIEDGNEDIAKISKGLPNGK